jgi:hypothetical protein
MCVAEVPASKGTGELRGGWRLGFGANQFIAAELLQRIFLDF